MEVSLQLMNIFQRPNYDATTFVQGGTFRNASKWDWYGASISFVKRFGNQKVKENTKTDVEKKTAAVKIILMLNFSIDDGLIFIVRFFIYIFNLS
jgi:hypothetical protein